MEDDGAERVDPVEEPAAPTVESSPAIFQRKREPTSAHCSTPVVLVVAMEEGKDADGKGDGEEEDGEEKEDGGEGKSGKNDGKEEKEEEEEESTPKETEMDTKAIDTASSADGGVPQATEMASMAHEEHSFQLAKTVHTFVSSLVESGHSDAEVWDAFCMSFTHGPATFTRRKPCFTGSINRVSASEAIPHHFQHEVEEDGSTKAPTDAVMEEEIKAEEAVETRPVDGRVPTEAVVDAAENESLGTMIQQQDAAVTTESLDTMDLQEVHTSDTTSSQLEVLNMKVDAILEHLKTVPHAETLDLLEAPPPLSREVEVGA